MNTEQLAAHLAPYGHAVNATRLLVRDLRQARLIPTPPVGLSVPLAPGDIAAVLLVAIAAGSLPPADCLRALDSLRCADAAPLLGTDTLASALRSAAEAGRADIRGVYLVMQPETSHWERLAGPLVPQSATVELADGTRLEFYNPAAAPARPSISLATRYLSWAGLLGLLARGRVIVYGDTAAEIARVVAKEAAKQAAAAEARRQKEAEAAERQRQREAAKQAAAAEAQRDADRQLVASLLDSDEWHRHWLPEVRPADPHGRRDMAESFLRSWCARSHNGRDPAPLIALLPEVLTALAA